MRDLINLIESVSENADDDWHEAVADEDWSEALSNSSSAEQVKEVLRLADATSYRIGINKNAHPVWVIDNKILEWDGTEIYPLCENIQQWLYDVDLETYFPGYEERFNSDFWHDPSPLYHETTPENASLIEHEGIRVSNLTRGINNRGVGASIFTTTNLENTYEGHYGGGVFEIDTQSMKSDGLTPYVSQEPGIAENELRQSLAHQLDVDFDPDHESGIHEDTVIIYGNIPAKYLHREK